MAINLKTIKLRMVMGTLIMASLLPLTSSVTLKSFSTNFKTISAASDDESYPPLGQQSDRGERRTVPGDDVAALSVMAEVGNWPANSLETKMSVIQHSEDLFEADYFDLVHHNISSDFWLNYTCQSLETANDAIKTVVEPIICVCGICGILISMVVLTRKSMCTSCNCYLTALAVGDLLFLIILLVRTVVEELVDCEFHISSARVVFFEYSIIFMDVFQYLTVGVTVMLAVERYIAICHPMRARSLCTVKRARTIIVLLAVVAFILRSPKFFDLKFTTGRGPNGETILVVDWAYPYNEKLYTYIVTICLLTILPLLALIVLNTLIILEIRRSSRFLRTFLSADRRVQSAVSSEELKITMMLVAVIMAFFVCNTPYMVYNIMIATMDYDTVDNAVLIRTPGFRYFKLVCHTLLAVRSSCNFALYCWFSEKFRATFQRVFFPPCYMPGARPYHLAPHGHGGGGNGGHFRGRSVGGFGFGYYKNCPSGRRTDSRYASTLSHTSNTTINRSMTVNYGRETTC